MSDQITCSWAYLSLVQRRHQIVETTESYADGLRHLTGKNVKLSLSFVPAIGLEDNGYAVFTIEAEL